MKKLSQLPQELQNASIAQLQQVQSCELCGGNHTNGQCAMQSTSQEEKLEAEMKWRNRLLK